MKILATHRATLKLLFVGAISLAMLIPLLMIGAVINERQAMQSAAAATIASRWGGSQAVGGLVWLSETTVPLDRDGTRRTRVEWQAQVLSEMDLRAELATEMRYLGIYQLPVYVADITLRGRLDFDSLNQGTGKSLFWLPLGEVRGVREVSSLKLGNIELDASPLAVQNNSITGLQFELTPEQRDRLTPGGEMDYELALTLSGSDSINFLPLADVTRVSLNANWPHPEFVGQYLPIEREIESVGARARWQLLGLNRPYGDHWTVSDMPMHALAQAQFGMRLETPVDTYQRSERSVKYGFLFITLTFFTLFLFEVMTGHALHPVPYVLTGSALAVFYLLLLALSEYLAFGWAFALAAVALVGIITPYTGKVLGGTRRGYLVGAMLSLTYILLYVLVTAQHASLLLGSVSLLAAIGGLMYLTRSVDWYRYGNDSPGSQQTADKL
jgi:inner membrane protein